MTRVTTCPIGLVPLTKKPIRKRQLWKPKSGIPCIYVSVPPADKETYMTESILPEAYLKLLEDYIVEDQLAWTTWVLKTDPLLGLELVLLPYEKLSILYWDLVHGITPPEGTYDMNPDAIDYEDIAVQLEESNVEIVYLNEDYDEIVALIDEAEAAGDLETAADLEEELQETVDNYLHHCQVLINLANGPLSITKKDRARRNARSAR